MQDHWQVQVNSKEGERQLRLKEDKKKLPNLYKNMAETEKEQRKEEERYAGSNREYRW